MMMDNCILCGQHFLKLPSPAMNLSLVLAKKGVIRDANIQKANLKCTALCACDVDCSHTNYTIPINVYLLTLLR